MPCSGVSRRPRRTSARPAAKRVSEFARPLHERQILCGDRFAPEERNVMKDLFVFGVGFASGWAARMSIASVRESAVDLIAAGYRGAERLRVRVETEREFIEDLLAEGRARYEGDRAN